jgi:hypothetical protein
VALVCLNSVVLPLVVCVTFVVEEFDWGFASVVFGVRVVLDCVERTVELLFAVVVVSAGPACSRVPVLIEPLSASEAREPSLLSEEMKATLFPCNVPCRKSCPVSALVFPMMKMFPNLLSFPWPFVMV